VGQQVEAVIIKIDWEKNRIALSLRRALPDPWDNVEEKYPEGSSHAGQVTRLTDFGAFVELEPGVDGLIHISKLGAGKKLKHAREALSQGQSVEVKIEKVEKGKRRISLTVTGTAQAEEQDDEIDKYIEKGPPSLGSLGDILKGKFKPDGKRR
jgi:small subunit ribosomal protein S1